MTDLSCAVTVLGCGTCVPDARRYPSSYFLEVATPPKEWLLDMGSGSLQRLAQAGKSYQSVESVFLSHSHPDHVGSLLGFLQALSFTPGFTRTDALHLYVSPDVSEFIDVNFSFEPALRPEFPLHVHVLDGDAQVGGDGWDLLSKRMSHGRSTQGFRFTLGGKVVVYAADTEPCEEVVELSHKADLLILESSFPKSAPTSGHMTTFQAGKVALQSGAKRLLLTHFYPDVASMGRRDVLEEVRSSGFCGDTIIASDLLRIEV